LNAKKACNSAAEIVVDILWMHECCYFWYIGYNLSKIGDVF